MVTLHMSCSKVFSSKYLQLLQILQPPQLLQIVQSTAPTTSASNLQLHLGSLTSIVVGSGRQSYTKYYQFLWEIQKRVFKTVLMNSGLLFANYACV